MSDPTTHTTINISWEPNEDDATRIAKHIKPRLIRSFVYGVGWSGWITYLVVKAICHRLGVTPAWDVIGGLFGAVVIGLVFSLRREFRDHKDSQRDVRSVLCTPEIVTISYTRLGRFEYSLPAASMVRHNQEGVYIDWPKFALLIPARAFEGDDAESLRTLYIRAKETQNKIRIPPRLDAREFPVSILAQPSKMDIVHAYYGGWGKAYQPANNSIYTLLVLIGPTLFCVSLALYMQLSVLRLLVIALEVTLLGVIASGLFRLSPGFPLSIAQSRHPLKQPRRIGMGPSGVTVHDGKSPSIFGWETVQRLGDDSRLIYMQVPGDLILIPKSSFLDERHVAEFLDAAMVYQRGETPAIDQARAVWPPEPTDAV